MAGDTPRGICAVPKPPYTPLVTLAIVSVSMIVTQIGWSGFSVFVKATTASAEHHVDPLVFSLLRDAGAVPVLLLAAVLFDGLHQIKLKDMPILALGGSIGLFANQVCLNSNQTNYSSFSTCMEFILRMLQTAA